MRFSQTLAGPLLALGLLSIPAAGSAAQPPPRFAVPHFNFVRIEVADARKAVAFYVDGLGLHERGQVSPTEVFVGVDDGPTSTALNIMQRRAGQAAPPASTNLCFVVTDMTSALAKVAAAGGKLVTPTRRLTQPEAVIDIAFVDDLDGNHVELMQYLRLGPAS
jgi:predicted enzyme related to lactoylglutathione lyase